MAYTVAALGPDPGLRVAVLQDQIAAYNSAWPVSQRCPPSSPQKIGLSCRQREPTQVIGAAGAESCTR